MIKKFFRKYLFFFLSLGIASIITFFNEPIGLETFNIASSSFKQMISVVPPIMLLLGLMDVWVPREKVMKYMGDNSGVIGVILSIVIGSIAAGPMYASFPFTAVLLKKGVKFSNIIIFMNAWCVTKIPTVMFELTYLGFRFTFIRLLINLPGIIIMGYIVQSLLSKNDIYDIYDNKNV